MRRLLLLVVILAAACDPPVVKRVPGASTTPQLAIARSSRACGFDVSDGSTAAARYRYRYDARGRIAHATGTFTTGGDPDQIDYVYDHLDHLTHMVERRGATTEVDQTESYDSLGDLIEYTITQPSGTTRYTYSDLTATGQPKAEVISSGIGLASRYLLSYDATDRLVTATLLGGATTTYTYDDVAGRSLTVDTDNGSFHGVYLYDDQNRELSETWGGSDPRATASATFYAYTGEQLSTITYQQAAATGEPLATVEIDTMRYTCDEL